MESFLYQTRPTMRQMYLDPRTKIFLCLTVAFITLVSCERGYMVYAKTCVAFVPLVFLLILKKYKLVAYYVGMYALSYMLPYWLRSYLPPAVNVILSGMAAVFIQAIPSMSMFVFIISTTTVSEFIAAMDKMHIPKKVSVPVSSMFRFFPTIREEYRAIRDAMRLRRATAWSNPVEMLEFRMVPLLMGLMSIGNEMSASAMTRGLDAPCKRVNVCPIGFHWQDILAGVLCLIVWVIYIIAMIG